MSPTLAPLSSCAVSFGVKTILCWALTPQQLAAVLTNWQWGLEHASKHVLITLPYVISTVKVRANCCMVILEAAVCDVDELFCIFTDRCFYYFVHLTYISEGRLNKNKHLSKMFSKPEYYNLHESRNYCRTVVFDYISFSQVYLINWQLSVYCRPAVHFNIQTGSLWAARPVCPSTIALALVTESFFLTFGSNTSQNSLKCQILMVISHSEFQWHPQYMRCFFNIWQMFEVRDSNP